MMILEDIIKWLLFWYIKYIIYLIVVSDEEVIWFVSVVLERVFDGEYVDVVFYKDW